MNPRSLGFHNIYLAITV